MDVMRIDCTSCPVRDLHCDDCLVTALAALPAPDQRDDLPLTRAEAAAVDRFVTAGLVSVLDAGSLRSRRVPLAWDEAAG